MGISSSSCLSSIWCCYFFWRRRQGQREQAIRVLLEEQDLVRPIVTALSRKDSRRIFGGWNLFWEDQLAEVRTDLHLHLTDLRTEMAEFRQKSRQDR